MDPKRLFIYTDGASRGNPGPAAIGVVIQDSPGLILDTVSQCIGHATNNQAEYRAVIAGLKKALEMGASHIVLHSDSELLVRQLKGDYRIKNAALKTLFDEVTVLRNKFASFEALYIPREQNRKADDLANEALGVKAAAGEAEVSGIEVRPAAKADYPSLLIIMSEIERQHVEGVPDVFRSMSREEREKELDAIMSDKEAVLLVAVRDGHVLGYINLAVGAYPAEKHPFLLPRRYVKIRDLAVSLKHQRSGAGTALMRAAEELARERGIATIELLVWEFNLGAGDFYRKMGYTTANRQMWKHV
jgi:ribonuclease HI/ribosomal protein S18 acetylase RimI-like enzyme